MPSDREKSGIEAHFAELQSQGRKSDAEAAEKQRKINEGALLDLDREIARTGLDLSGKSPDEIVQALSDADETSRSADPYLGDTIEHLTGSTLNPHRRYGAGYRSSVSGRRATKPKRKRGQPFTTKEDEPRNRTVTARVTRETHSLLAAYKRYRGRNSADVLMAFANVIAAAHEGSKLAKWALHVLERYFRSTYIGKPDVPLPELLSVTLKGLPSEAA
jgi:hypothetical protein